MEIPMVNTKSEMLVETDWLEANLGDPDLRVIDCTAYMPNYFDESAAEGLEIVSGLQHWKEGHIPGSAFADLTTDLGGPDDARYMLPMPSQEKFAAAMSRLGVEDGKHIVLYDDMVNCFATRVWWMLKVHGFDDVSVLNGGWARWTAENRATSTEPHSYQEGEFEVRMRPDLIATKEDVLAAIDDGSVCLVNALDPDEYAGNGVVRYTRPGHIPGSENISFLGVIDPDTSRFLPHEQLDPMVRPSGVFDRDRVISYCGGAIAATSATFVMSMLGVQNVAVYEGSMTEWGADPELPLLTGSEAR